MRRFSVTYAIVTPESAENGDIADSGFIVRNVPLRTAFDSVFATRTSRCGGVESIEADEWPMRSPRSVRVCNGMEFETAAQESRSLHIPDHVTPSSRVRIARLMGAR